MSRDSKTKQLTALTRLLLLVALITISAGSAIAPHALAGGGVGPTRALTTTARRGIRGERSDVLESALNSISRTTRYELEERYVTHSVLSHGIDAIYRNVKTKRFNIVEAKATSSTGRLSLGILPTRAGGERQMDTMWVRKKLDAAATAARRILDDDAADIAQRMNARRTLNMVDEIGRRPLSRQERTLVITRLNGVDRNLLLNGQTITPQLRSAVDHVIEVSRSGRVLRVH